MPGNLSPINASSSRLQVVSAREIVLSNDNLLKLALSFLQKDAMLNRTVSSAWNKCNQSDSEIALRVSYKNLIQSKDKLERASKDYCCITRFLNNSSFNKSINCVYNVVCAFTVYRLTKSCWPAIHEFVKVCVFGESARYESYKSAQIDLLKTFMVALVARSILKKGKALHKHYKMRSDNYWKAYLKKCNTYNEHEALKNKFLNELKALSTHPKAIATAVKENFLSSSSCPSSYPVINH